MKNAILITGAAGYLGGHIIETITKAQPARKIVAIDNLSNHNKSILAWLKKTRNIEFIKTDYSKEDVLENVLTSYSVNDVIHLAARKYPTKNQI